MMWKSGAEAELVCLFCRLCISGGRLGGGLAWARHTVPFLFCKHPRKTLRLSFGDNSGIAVRREVE